MDSSILIIVLSLSVLISYAFDLFSSRLKTPSVLLLLLLGGLTRQATDYFGVQVPYANAILPTLGTLGLILIVLENGLDLELHHEKLSILWRTLLASLLSIVGTTSLLASVLYLLLNDSFYHCLITALPFSIISSSAVSVPGISRLAFGQSEFVVYESAFAGIIGVLVYNFLLLSRESVGHAFLFFARDTFIMALLSLGCCFLLLYLIGRINHRIKFLPIISVLFLVYAIAEINHLSSLLLILIFGLFLNNTELFIRGRLSQLLKNDLFEKELDQLKNLTAEGAFVVRTFFFLIFGFVAVPHDLVDPDALIVSALFIIVIVGWRWVMLRLVYRGPLKPLVWIAPRGLITILLYLNIPQDMRVIGFREGIPMLVIVLSLLVMMIGGLGYKPAANNV